MDHADVRIVRLRRRRGQENEARVQTCREVSLADQFTTNPAPLECNINGQVRQVRAVVEPARLPAGRGSGDRINRSKPEGGSYAAKGSGRHVLAGETGCLVQADNGEQAGNVLDVMIALRA